MAHFALAPARAVSDVARTWLENPVNPLYYTAAGRKLAASAKIFERLTPPLRQAHFASFSILKGGLAPVPRAVWHRCPGLRQKVLIVAPMSNRHATLLRGTVEAFLPFYDVYITDWADSRTLPLSAGRFDLDDYIDYVIAICETLSKEHDGLSLHQAKPNLAEIWLIHRANRLTP